MTMQPEQGISRELGLGEVISKTFEVTDETSPSISFSLR